jgi:hypothetical protein
MTRATVREIDGQLVLDDPDALAVARAVARENVRRLLITPEVRERIRHFAGRIKEPHADEGTRLLIVWLCVDDPSGAAIAEILMPGHDWSAIRARGEVPFARGLAERAGVQAMLDSVTPTAGAELRAIEGIAVLAVDRGIGAVFAEAAL